MKTVFLYQAESHFEALSIKDELESRGIVCLMPNEHLSSVMPFYTPATGGYRLFVSETSLEEARNVLKMIVDVDTLTDTSNLETCPLCYGEHTRLEKKPRRGLIVSLMILFFVPVPAYSTRYVCLDCGHRWKERLE